MARIRSIHPGLLTDDAFMALTVETPVAVALLIGLLTEADDEGIFEWKPMSLKARILPAVTVEIGPLLDALVLHRFIIAYEIDGRKLGAVRNFCKWQRPKSPTHHLPKTEAIRAWVGLPSKEKGNKAATPTETVPQAFPTPSPSVPDPFPIASEISPQRKEGGGRREEEEERLGLACASERATPRPPDDPVSTPQPSPSRAETSSGQPSGRERAGSGRGCMPGGSGRSGTGRPCDRSHGAASPGRDIARSGHDNPAIRAAAFTAIPHPIVAGLGRHRSRTQCRCGPGRQYAGLAETAG